MLVSSFHTKLTHLCMISPVHVENLETIDVQKTNDCFPGGILQRIYKYYFFCTLKIMIQIQPHTLVLIKTNRYIVGGGGGRCQPKERYARCGFFSQQIKWLSKLLLPHCIPISVICMRHVGQSKIRNRVDCCCFSHLVN